MTEAVPELSFPGEEESAESEETMAPEELPDFTKMKKAELIEFIEEYEVPIEGPGSMTKAKLVKALQGAFGQFVPKSLALEEGNTLHDVVKQIESIQSEAQAIDEVNSVQDQSNFALFRIGGILKKMRAHNWCGDGEVDFFEFVDATFAMKRSKALYSIAIYEKLVELDLPWSDASELGWTKLRLLHTILDEENATEILAAVKGMSVREVAQYSRDYKQKGPGGQAQASDSAAVKRLSFAVHEDQVENIKLALEKAKEDGNTTFDGMALDYICLDYLGGGAKPKPKAAKPMSIVDAIKHAKANVPEDKQGEMLAEVSGLLTELWPEYFEAE